jgi:xanthine dehydrogenase YagS FAD-binding subunit
MHAIFGVYKCFAVHPSDLAPALVALDAKVSITGPKGSRQMPLGSFFITPKVDLRKENVLVPGEVVTEVLLDAPQAGTRSKYRKVRERGALYFALAGAAIVVVLAGGTVKSARIVLSGVATVPWRSAEAEQAIVGKALDAATAAAAGAAAVKGAHLLAENGYKVPLAHALIRRTLLKLKG